MEAEWRWVIVDSETALLAAEMRVYSNDLDAALEAFGLIEGLDEEEYDFGRLREHLVASAIIAYWRCFPTRLGKPSLARRIEMTELAEVHERSRLWRNRLVAHTDSGMTSTITHIPLVKNGDNLELQPPSTLTRRVSAPQEAVSEFAYLVHEIRTKVLERSVELRDALAREFSDTDLMALWDMADTSSETTFPDWNPGQ
jgi:hypothetical protein